MKRDGLAIQGIIPSGVALLDEWIAGVRDDGLHLVTGGSGAGKSTFALQFADACLRRRQPVAMLVNARVDDMKSHARYIGMNLDAPLRDGRLLLLRYRPDFVHRGSHAVSSEQVIGDLAHFIAPHNPARVIIDTVSPFITGPMPVRSSALALVEWLERLGSTTLLTLPEDVTAAYDRAIEPLVQNAAAVIRFTREDSDIRRAELVNLRYPVPATSARRFVIRERVGIVAERMMHVQEEPDVVELPDMHKVPEVHDARSERVTLEVQ